MPGRLKKSAPAWLRKSHSAEVGKYVDDVVSGIHIAGNNRRECERYLRDRASDEYIFLEEKADYAINLFERLIVNRKGETPDGRSLANTPLQLQPWQKFIIYNLLGFYKKSNPNERRFKEAFIFVPRKNGKTTLVAGLALVIAIIQRHSGSMVYIVAAALAQARESFDTIVYTLRHYGLLEEFRKLDNALEHSLTWEFMDDDGNVVGTVKIQALAANPDAQDSFNCNVAIADEIHAFRKAKQYTLFLQAMKSYTNKLMIGITTAGDNVDSYCYRLLQNAERVLDLASSQEELFCFVSHADVDPRGDVDYMNPVQWEKANPSYGVIIRPGDMRASAYKAQGSSDDRGEFLRKELNIFTNSVKAYFNIAEFSASDKQYSWTLDELSRMKIKWYGGADLSKLHDLSAACLYGNYAMPDGRDVDIVIPHAFFPVTAAVRKAEEDRIPLFDWRDHGWLTMSNQPTVAIGEIVDWFIMMRSRGFNIVKIGHDPKFAGDEFFPQMKKAGFNIEAQLQVYYLKGQGFRRIERKAKNGELYFLHCEAYLYCVSNVKALERIDDMPMYEKVEDTSRIDLFDASVFGSVKMLNEMTKPQTEDWFRRKKQ